MGFSGISMYSQSADPSQCFSSICQQQSLVVTLPTADLTFNLHEISLQDGEIKKNLITPFGMDNIEIKK